MHTNQSLSSYWMPFSSNQDFKAHPRLLTKAEGHYYQSEDGRKIYDSFSGLWTSGLGHCHPKIVEAVQAQVAELDYAMAFQMGHPKAFDLANRISSMAPDGFEYTFFCNSGSEAADSALKIALAYHHANGDATRTRFVGRERGYHGTNFGGISVGGMVANRKVFSPCLLPGVDHLPHTLNLSENAFSKGLPKSGAHLADELERICALHDPSNIAAVIIEPAPGSTGVLPPPQGYLKRLRDICDRHGILLIFDEVINAFGRIGASFAAERFDVTPDIITTAKGITNGVIPMGAVIVTDRIYNSIVQGPPHLVEFFHGYTYSGHPVAAAAALATLDVYEDEGSFDQARSLEGVFEEAIHSVANHPNVIDVRNVGLMGAIELAPHTDGQGIHGLEAHKRCYWDEDLVIRNGGDILQFAPFLNSKPDDIYRTFEKVKRVLESLG
ncbi:aspartate aminotransferase family protein [Hyphococcus flavus]|uniref:Aspartate aminotransferase family protein n=1 Tax=Hyphococcus flavus TaxID=1866326 RepID=A0AAE9ZH38_9PROT|nr:aspartate aminotransferase family protein [Hyphococcus flavus]WDI30075.1 aspartate aminotransferase family protein [Hyphococcus flavus]